MADIRIKLTDAVVGRATLPAGRAEVVLWDADVTGFGLRLRGAAKSYIIMYRPIGSGRAANMRRMKIGTPETIASASEARRLARAALGKVAAGGDPAADRAEQKRRSKARLKDLLDRYESALAQRQYVARKMVMSLLRRRLAAHLDRDIAEIRGADLVQIVEKLERAGLAGAADEFRSRCRAFFSWAMVQAKVIDQNPLAGYRRQRATRADRLAKAQHGRALPDDELVRLWSAAHPETLFGRFVRFLVLTGCRRGEATGLTWQMIDRAGGLIELPSELTKSGRPHTIVITPMLDRLLDQCRPDARSDQVFPSMRTGGPISGWNKMTAALVAKSDVSFSPHDLRRTFRTGLSRLGIETEAAELAIGHARANLIEIYNRDQGLVLLRRAFAAWSGHVESQVQPNCRNARPNEDVFA